VDGILADHPAGIRPTAKALRHLQGSHWLIGCLLVGSGLRLMEAVRLRVKDLDFEHRAMKCRLAPDLSLTSILSQTEGFR
jgi:integrase